MSFTGAIPILNVKNVLASIYHYTTVLGFNRSWDWPKNDTHKTFACVTNGDVNLFLSEGSQGGRPGWIYYDVDDISKVYESYGRSGANITEMPTDKPWGMREMLVEDPDGHVLRIGEAIKSKE